LEARGIDDASLVAGINRRTLGDLRNWTEEATKVLVF
jgi:sulfur relay (sulfurtransferase) complex TusBCD TusD component (DsrE family)